MKIIKKFFEYLFYAFVGIFWFIIMIWLFIEALNEPIYCGNKPCVMDVKKVKSDL